MTLIKVLDDIFAFEFVCKYQIMVQRNLSSSSYVSCSTSQNFWMSFPRTSWVSCWTTLSSQRRVCQWRWSHPQHPQHLSSRQSTVILWVRSRGPSHRSPMLTTVTASMMVNSEQGPWHLGHRATWGCGVWVIVLSAPVVATSYSVCSFVLGLWGIAERHRAHFSTPACVLWECAITEW